MRSPESVERLVQPLYRWASRCACITRDARGAVMRASYRNSPCCNGHCCKGHCQSRRIRLFFLAWLLTIHSERR
jgi:hypothetical protein